MQGLLGQIRTTYLLYKFCLLLRKFSIRSICGCCEKETKTVEV